MVSSSSGMMGGAGATPVPVLSNNSTALTPKSSSSSMAQLPVNIDSAKIFVGGLSWQTNEDALRFHFERFGTVVSVEVMRDRNTGDPRGFAFVVFEDDPTVDVVLRHRPHHEIDRKVVDVKRAQARGFAPPSVHVPGAGGEGPLPPLTPSSNIPPNHHGGQQQQSSSMEINKVFVGGLAPGVDREELSKSFSQFGKVVDAIVMMDPTHRRSRGFGFVTFEPGDGGAQRALEKQKSLSIQNKTVEIKLAMPKEQQQQQAANSNGGGGAFNNNKGFGINAAATYGGFGGPPGNGVLPTALTQHPICRVVAPVVPPAPKGRFAGLADAYGKSGWKAGYGSNAFGKAGWCVQGWEDYNPDPDETGFSFEALEISNQKKKTTPDSKKRSSSKDGNGSSRIANTTDNTRRKKKPRL